jgi:ribulose-bisphosphate carboxylase large chain
MKIFVSEVDKTKNVIVTYDLEGSISLKQAAWELAIGQSVGNPHSRSVWETDDLFETYSCKIIGSEEELATLKRAHIQIAFPVVNTNWKEDGITQLLVQIMGGNTDIAQITYCRVLKIEFPEEVLKHFKGPKFGIKNIRSYTGISDDRPLLGGIVKPKTGISPQILLEMVKAMVEGGCSFIKEDEILSGPDFCRLEDRVPLVMSYINEHNSKTDKKVVYCVCINADSPYMLDRVRKAHELGANGIHVNFWAGLGIYRSIRDLDLPLFVHYQSSGLKILTDKQHRFSIDMRVICQLAGISGVDFFHAGMLFGYGHYDQEDVIDCCEILRSLGTMPTMSCGLSAENVNKITDIIGPNYVANSGGSIHSHPEGTTAGARKIKATIDSRL